MHHAQIIKGLLDILNSNHEKLKLTNEQIAVKNEAHKLTKNSAHPFTYGCVKLTTDWRAALQSDRDMKNKIAKYPVMVSKEFIKSTRMYKHKKAPTSEA